METIEQQLPNRKTDRKEVGASKHKGKVSAKGNRRMGEV
jgi:hypothetical protein